uniref:Uncharacterized protein n=1 Tax=Phenylobacterium glaciei TaxID=2803784 RepID=A0A974S9F9_9CAUL|nr:hypothetical protein JKL49_03885 [Phenylobacterium glaciei]
MSDDTLSPRLRLLTAYMTDPGSATPWTPSSGPRSTTISATARATCGPCCGRR